MLAVRAHNKNMTIVLTVPILYSNEEPQTHSKSIDPKIVGIDECTIIEENNLYFLNICMYIDFSSTKISVNPYFSTSKNDPNILTPQAIS